MKKLITYNLQGQKLQEVEIQSSFLDQEIGGQLIKDYIVALRANARQWSANTKGRSEVSHSTQKPHHQKGLGRSRQGSLAAPQYKGGGRVFGPKPKFDQHVKINRKERRLAIRSLIADKIREGCLHLLQSTELQEPKTASVQKFLDALNLAGKRVLFLGEQPHACVEVESQLVKVSVYDKQHHNFTKSVRNLPKAEFALLPNASGYALIRAHDLVITEAAWKEFMAEEEVS